MKNADWKQNVGWIERPRSLTYKFVALLPYLVSHSRYLLMGSKQRHIGRLTAIIKKNRDGHHDGGSIDQLLIGISYGGDLSRALILD